MLIDDDSEREVSPGSKRPSALSLAEDSTRPGLTFWSFRRRYR